MNREELVILINKMLERLDDKRLRRVYVFVMRLFVE